MSQMALPSNGCTSIMALCRTLKMLATFSPYMASVVVRTETANTREKAITANDGIEDLTGKAYMICGGADE